MIAVAAGSFQSELGCPSDWDPACLRSWLQDPDGDGIYSFETTALPQGSYEGKVAINESWDENYGQGGVPNGPNIAFNVPVAGAKVTFTYDASTHVLTIAATVPGAPGGPGALSHFDLARKDCLGTARNTRSKVWYTVANGVLSDVYYPTIDNTNLETLQYVVTDGSTFTDLQTRDMTYAVRAVNNAGGMVCEVTATAKSGRYRIETEYITDPNRNSVLMRVKFKPRDPGYRLYVRFDPTVNGNGGGGAGNGGADSATVDDSTGHPVLVSSDPVTATNAANRDYAQPVFAALDGSFGEASSGFVGASSDGLVQLDASHALTDTYADAFGGNVVQTARVVLDDGGQTVLALGFGSSQEEAVGTAEGSLGVGFTTALEDYKEGWKQYDNSLLKPRTESLPGIKATDRQQLEDAYYLSANVIKASEDKTFPGAIVASLASPWGQAVSAGDPANTYFGSYREVFARDLYESWTGLVAAGDLATARDATLFLFERQQLPDGSMPRNSLVNGKVAPDSFGTQLDETAYPILMAQQLGLTDASLYANHIRPAANFLIARGPAFGVERWEEQSGFSPSTIAAEIAGLAAAAELARANGDTASAAVWLGVADDWQRSVKGWTVTTSGPHATHPYFIRLSKTGDPNAAISYNVGNGGPTLDQRAVIDAGFLELVRLGELPPNDPDVLRSLPVVDATIKKTTERGPGWHRYNGDGYGDRATDGRPWAPSGQGNGHLWPALSAERGEHELVTGDSAEAASLLLAMSRFSSGVGLIPEQNWELPDLDASPFGTDPTIASIGFENGGAAGSASPLTWSAASFVRLARDLATGRNVVLPAVTHTRYVANTQGTTPLTVTSPADNSSVTSSPVTVTGTTAPGNAVYVSSTNTDTNAATTVRLHDGGRRRLVQRRRPDHGRHQRPERRRRQSDRRHRPRAADGPPRRPARNPAPRRRRPGRRRRRPRELRVSDLRRLPPGRLRHPAVPGLRLRRHRHLPAADPRPVGDVRQPARRAARRRLRTRPRGGGDVHGGGASVAQLRDRTGVRVEPADPGAGLRPALRGRGRQCTRDGDDLGESDLTLHHLQRPEGVPRDARPRLGLRRRPHRPGRLQPRQCPQLRADAAGVPVRSLRDRERRSPLHVRPRPRSEGGRRHPHTRGAPVHGARLHARPRAADGRRDPVDHARTTSWRSHGRARPIPPPRG